MSAILDKWKVARISEFAKTTSGGTPSRQNPRFYTGNIPWIKSGDLNDGNVSEATEFITEEALKSSSAKLFPAGTLMIALYGATIGKLGVLTIEAATNQAVCGIFVPEEIETKYLFYFLLHHRGELIKLGAGGAQPNISQGIIRDVKVPIAPLPEQRRIVARIEELFSRLDAGLAALRHAKAQLQRYRQSVLAAAVNGQLTKAWREQHPDTEPAEELLERTLKQRREEWDRQGKYKEPDPLEEIPLESIPESWAWASIAQIGFVQLGRQRSPKNRPKDYPTKYIRAANITEDGLALTDLLEMEFSPSEQSRFRLKFGDLVLSEASGSPDQVGKPAIWKDEIENCCFQNTVIRLRALGFNNEFILILLKHFHRNKVFAKVAGGVGINHLSAAKFSKMAAAVPPIAEQHQIVAEVEARFTAIDHLEVELDRQITRSNLLRQSTLVSAFCGELVRQDPNEETAINFLGRIPPTELRYTRTRLPRTEHVEKPTEKISTPAKQIERVKPVPAPQLQNVHRVESSTIHLTSMRQTRLIQLKLHEDYSSLKAGVFDLRSLSDKPDRLAPLCLVGLNGSGKSNLIEILSEIFCHVELSLLDWQDITQKQREVRLGFDLEYQVFEKQFGDSFLVRLTNRAGGRPQFVVVRGDDEQVVEDPKERLKLLPSRIIGYSSGHNETISIPYFRTASVYSDEVLKQAGREEKSKTPLPDVQDSRALFMDYECNALIFVANYLLQPTSSLQLFRKNLRVNGLESFEIRFRPTYQGKKPVKLTNELKRYIKIIRESATSIVKHDDGITEVFRFVNLSSAAQILKKSMGCAETLFGMFYKLSLLNALALTGKERNFYLQDDLGSGQLERPPTIPRSQRIFSLQKIKVSLTNPKTIIDYAGLSDGEHQFLQIFGGVLLFGQPGCVFLLDEPETHFNPQWRRMSVKWLANIRSSAQQELVISTHSPFVVSGCKGKNVFRFLRKGGKCECSSVDIETFGASYDFLLSRLFGMDTMVAAEAIGLMEELIKDGSINDLRAAIPMFGESFEKRFMFERIAQLEKKRRKKP